MREGHDHAVDQRCYRLGDQRLMTLRVNGDLLPQHGCELGSPGIGTVHNELRFHITFRGLYAGDLSAFGLKADSLAECLDLHAHLPGAVGIGLGGMERIGMSVRLAESSARNAFQIQIRDLFFHLCGRELIGVNAEPVLDFQIFAELDHFLIRIRYQQIAALVELNAPRITGILFHMLEKMRALEGDRGVQFGTPLLSDACTAAAGGSCCEESLLDQQDVLYAALCQFKGQRTAVDTAADDHDFICFFHSAPPPS